MISEIKDFLIVKDNFFEKKVYDEILKDISTLKFTNRNTYVPNKNVYQQTYFNVPLNKNHFAVIEVLKILKNMG